MQFDNLSHDENFASVFVPIDDLVLRGMALGICGPLTCCAQPVVLVEIEQLSPAS